MTFPNVEPVNGGDSKYGVTVSSLQDDIVISGNKISGTSKYYDGINWSPNTWSEDEKTGNFLVLDFSGVEGTIATKVINGNNTYIPVTDDYCIYRIGDGTSTKTNKKIEVKISNSRDRSADTTTIYDLSGMNLIQQELTKLDITTVKSGAWGTADYSTMSESLSISGTEITGTLKYYDGNGWPAEAWPEEKKAGNFLVLHVTADDGVKPQFKLTGGDTNAWKTLSKSSDDIVFRVTDNDQIVEIKAQEEGKRENHKSYTLTNLTLNPIA